MARRVAIPKKLEVSLESPWKQNPVVDSTEGKFTAVFLIPYHHTRGVIMRDSGKATLVGYCVESPRDVLETAFGDYHITRYNGYDLFGGGDFESTTPMLGLGIVPVEPPKVYGIEYNGRLENLLQLDELLKAKRDGPISSQDVQRILAYLSEDSNHGFMNPNNNQVKHDMQEIIDIVKKFG
jgi:hypothetical protein